MEWWEEEYRFFGQFYQEADHSDFGYDVSRRLSLYQRTENEIKWIFSYLNPKQGSLFLDCPCGSGRHSIALANEGFRVIGVDINSKMLSYKTDYHCTKKENLNLFQMDMRELKFPEHSFDYVINMFISFGFFDSDSDNLKVASEFYRVLKPNGQLFLHLDLNYDNVINGHYDDMQNIFRTCRYKGKCKRLQIEEKYDPDTKRLYGTWKLVNGTPEIKKYSLRVYDNEKEFIPLFKSVGFRDVTLLDPIRKKVCSDTVDTILIAKK